MTDEHSAQRQREAQPAAARRAEAQRQAARTTVTSTRGTSETRERRYS